MYEMNEFYIDVTWSEWRFVSPFKMPLRNFVQTLNILKIKSIKRHDKHVPVS